MINLFGFSVLQRCALYLQAYSTGNPIPLMRNSQEILNKVPSEVMIFQQKPRPRGLTNPKDIIFSLQKDRLNIPLEDEFTKEESMIGEFLKFSSSKLPPTIEATWIIASSSVEDIFRSSAITPPTKDVVYPSEITSLPSLSPRKAPQNFGVKPQPSVCS